MSGSIVAIAAFVLIVVALAVVFATAFVSRRNRARQRREHAMNQPPKGGLLDVRRLELDTISTYLKGLAPAEDLHEDETVVQIMAPTGLLAMDPGGDAIPGLLERGIVVQIVAPDVTGRTRIPQPISAATNEVVFSLDRLTHSLPPESLDSARLHVRLSRNLPFQSVIIVNHHTALVWSPRLRRGEPLGQEFVYVFERGDASLFGLFANAFEVCWADSTDADVAAMLA